MKILFIGSAPLPIEKNTIDTAFGLRTWQFLKPLLAEKNVELYVFLLASPEKYPKDHPLTKEKSYEPNAKDFYLDIFKNHTLKKICFFDKSKANSSTFWQKIYHQINPDLLLGINIHPAYIASKIKRTCPFWADLNGWTMAEGQAQAALWQSNELLPRLWNMEKNVLATVDRCSVVSLPQKYATIGELAVIGRLNRWTHNYTFVEVIENAMDEELPGFSSVFSQTDTSILQEINYEPHQKIILSIGAYNTWIDSQTLLKGLEVAMEKDHDIIFVNTGEGIPGLSEKYYQKFVNDCKKSKFAERLKNVGWISRSRLNALLQVASAGINVDLPIYETFFGARNRINEYLLWNLPVITTQGSLIADTLIKNKAAIGVEPQNVEDLARKLVHFLNRESKNNLSLIQKNAENCRRTMYSIKGATKPFIDWLLIKQAAPDFKKHKPCMEKQNRAKQAFLYLSRNGLKKVKQKLFKSKIKT